MNPSYEAVAVRAGHRCEYCHAPERVFNSTFEVEHIVPQASYGGNALENLALACRSCNLFKADIWSAPDPDTGDAVALFHPRQDRWDEHFRIETSAAAIVGISSCGRATVARLRMNRPHATEARRLWIAFGVFP